MQSITVVGGGFAGLSIAMSLQRTAKVGKVTIIDRNPTSGTTKACSYGNAGVMAGYEILGMNQPGMLTKLPFMLSCMGGPVGIRGLQGLPSWGIKYLKASQQHNSDLTMKNLAAVARNAGQSWEDIFTDIGPDAKENFTHQAHILLATDANGIENLRSDNKKREAHGFTSTFYEDQKDLKRLEPVVFASTNRFAAAATWENTWSFTDPSGLLTAMGETIIHNGGTWVHDTVKSISPHTSTVYGNSDTYSSDAIVLAAGWETPLLYPHGAQSLPVIGERGYHIEFPMPDGCEEIVRHSFGWQPGKFFITPMKGRLRAAGLSEWGSSPESPPIQARFEFLEKQVRDLLPHLPPRDASRDWMGTRPTTPDYLPVVSRVPGHPNVFLLCGHGHLGATLSPVTADMLAGMITGVRHHAGIDVEPFSVERF
eukprot:TRINITY_DN1734_c2_g2_i1.p1 TRINITY_DN1734_c2_g2~~TRINITY_DN1734_c2_g2_i1.p1  ORF type:complete len:452 (+),score=56.57 TRINITY_DN1734_c2_g2_i1:83-1357(+)